MSLRKIAQHIGSQDTLDMVNTNSLNERVVARLYQIAISNTLRPSDTLNAIKIVAEIHAGKYEEQMPEVPTGANDIDNVKKALEKITSLEDLEKLAFPNQDMDGVL